VLDEAIRVTMAPKQLLSLLLVLLAATTSLVSAEVTDEWTFPKASDRAATLELGKDITIGWTPKLQTWWPAYCPGCDPKSANLYITSVGISGQLPFKHKIASTFNGLCTPSFALEPSRHPCLSALGRCGYCADMVSFC
jgi:hypothetical protein